MTALWTRWVRWCNRPVDTRPAAMVRILVPLVIVLDQLRLLQLGLVDVIYKTWDNGGLSAFDGVDFLFPQAGPWIGPALWALVLLCMALVGSGLAARPAILVGVLAYAQLGHLYPPGDRGIDRVLRTVLLLLALSLAHRRWSLGNRLRGRAPVRTMPAWPIDLVKLLLVLIYLGAGFAKVSNSGWLSLSGTPMLYRIMVDPTAARLDHLSWADHFWLFRLGGYGTIVLELSAPLLLTRWAPWWAIFGALMHLGIATTMGLGMFSFGMLALYPLLLAPWILRRLDRR